MSFLAGRLAGKEGAFFLQESKQAVARLIETQKAANVVRPIAENNEVPSADVLPEVLRHHLPSKILRSPPLSSSSTFSDASKWALKTDPNNVSGVSADALNPLRAYVSLPQATFGPKRWQLPSTDNSFLASTANDLRHDKYTPINPEKLKSAAAGLSQIGLAFAFATAIVFGGGTLTFAMAASKLEMNSADDIRTKGKDLVQPTLEIIREQLVPLRTWAGELSKKWHLEREETLKENPLIKELSKKLGAKNSP